jgi:hypothetical protein
MQKNTVKMLLKHIKDFGRYTKGDNRKMTMFTIGTDPEFFVRHKANSNLISAIPFVMGTKDIPQDLPAGGNIQRDNVAVEMATNPAYTRDEFVDNIRKVLHGATEVLPSYTEIVALPSASFDPKELEHPEAQEFGCSPDFDAWTMSQNEKPFAMDQNFRSCGAHIHVGTVEGDENGFLLEIWGKIAMVKTMDCFHGIISTILDSGPDAIARRQLYGKPGAHRPTDYGVEYRVLSNWWLKSPVTVMMMYHLTDDALAVVRNEQTELLVKDIGQETVRKTIMSGDVKTARIIVEDHIIPLMSGDSMFHYNEAVAKVAANDMHFHEEWGLYGKEAA